MSPLDSWLLVLAVVAGFVTLVCIVWHDIDRWLAEWRDQGVDQAFGRTRDQIRALPETREFCWEEAERAARGSEPDASADSRSASSPFDWDAA